MEETESPNYIPYAEQSISASWQAADAKAAIVGSLKRPMPETPVQRLERRREEARKELARLDELIELLKANPTTERILQLLGVGV
jgi:hypothetical protein